MRLIAVLIVLGLDRWLNIGKGFRHYGWVNGYIALLHKSLGSTIVWRSWAAVAIILLPALIIVGLILVIIAAAFHELVALVLSIVILLYCLGPVGLHQQFRQYMDLLEDGKEDEAQKLAGEILGKKAPQDKGELSHQLTQTMVTQINQRLFAVVFWFIVLGAVGALLYRLIALIKELASNGESMVEGLLGPAQQIQAVLDWVPARLVALTYALAGNFDAVMKKLMGHIWGGLQSSSDLLDECGNAALGDVGSESEEKQTLMVMDLIDRALFIWLIIYAMAVVAVWVF